MKKLPIVLSAVAVLSFSTVAYAAKNESAGTGMGSTGSTGTTTPMQSASPMAQAQQKGSATPSGMGAQTQNQVMTKNQGEDTQLQVKTMEQSQTANGVSQAVQSLLAIPERKGGIGQEVKLIAQAQNDDQPNITANLAKIQSRSKFVKSLFGVDQKSLQELKQLQAKNQQRIESMQQLMTQTTNESELTELKLAIQAMVDQNAEIATEIVTADATPGLFGWMFRLFKLQ